jgi:WD40 repeat protein
VWTWRTDGPANLADGSPLGAPETPAASGADREPSRAVGLGFSGERVYAISSSGRVRAWDATTRQPVLDVAPGGFTGVSWRENDRAVAVTDTNAAWPGALPGGSVLVATGSGRVLDLDLDRRRAQEVVPAGRLAEPITALSVREFPRGDVLAVGTGRGLQLWNLAKHRQEASPIPDASPVLGVRFSPTLTNLLVSSTDRVSIVGTSPDGGHDLDQPEPLASDTGGPATLVADGATPNGLIAVGHANGRMTVIDPVDGGGTALTPLDASTVVAFGSSGRLLVTDTVSSSRVEGLHTVTIPKGAPDTAYRTAQSLSPDPQWWSGGNFYVNDAVHADNLILVAGQASSQEERYPHGAVMVWDTRTGEPLRELDFPGGNPDLVSAVRYLPAAALIAARNTEGALRVWSTRTWQRVLDRTVGRGGTMTVIPDTATAVLPVLADPGGERPAQAKGALAFVDLRTGRTRNVELDVPVDRVAASPRGDYIVVAGAGGRVRYLEPDGSTKKGFPAITLPSTVSGVAVDPRGERVAFALANGRVMVYLAATGALAVPPFVEPDGEVPVRLSWHPDGDLLAIAGLTYQGDDPIAKPVRLWRSRSTSWRDRLCGIAGRNLTRQEWHRHVGDGTPYRRLCARFG